ncbi:MAG: hypothetical protein ACREQX_01935 [Candidatus Binataceae bacterium]
MRSSIFLAASALLCTLSAAGCLQVQPQPAAPPTSVSSSGPFGNFTFTSGAACSGHTTLANGNASVDDPCFTGSDNVVMCTDTTSPSAVQCAPSDGHLSVSGTAGDTIAYARIR